MPMPLTAPGVYIEEVPSGVHTITGVASAIAAFVGYTKTGRDGKAKRIFGFPDFERAFGGLASDSELSYAVNHFFQNGGGEAYVVRVPREGAKTASVMLLDEDGGTAVLKVSASSTGTWGNGLIVDVDYEGATADDEFNLSITDVQTGRSETFRAVSIKKSAANAVDKVLKDEDAGSSMVTVEIQAGATKRPAQTGTLSEKIAVDADGKPTGIPDTKNLLIKISTDRPASGALNEKSVSLMGKDDARPASLPALCRLLERKLSAELPPGSSVSCTSVQSGNDTFLRIVATIPHGYDAVLSFDPGTAAGDDADADAVLKLSTGEANVAHYWIGSDRGAPQAAQGATEAGTEGSGLPNNASLIGDESKFTGLYALNKVDLFNILSIPDATRASADDPAKRDAAVDPNTIYAAAITLCEARRAMLLIDPSPEVNDVDSAMQWKTFGLKVNHRNGAAYFPRVRLPDPLNDHKLRTFAPSGVVAGLYARTDANRGVWKAPAGVEATLNGVQGVVYRLSDAEQGALNPLGLNCVRVFAVHGVVCWGARTLKGADAAASEWKYVPVRRTALFLEESLYRGLKWAVFEPNDEPLWSQIRLNVGAFMQTLFRQGAFQGMTPREAYFVKCDAETTTQDDRNRGVVNVLVGFAPLKPAEFIVVKIQQMAGQVQV